MSASAVLSQLLAPRGCGEAEPLRQAVEGKTVLVTGASFGIGAALCLRLGQAGARVLMAARSHDSLAELAAQITTAGGQAYSYPLDLRQPEQIETAAQTMLSDHGRVDVVVHNAGKSIRRSVYGSLDRAHDFDRTMAVNYLGPVRLQLALLPAMITGGGGHIVNVSSVGVRLPAATYWAAYSASKSAFDIWLGSMAPELKHGNIDCSSLYFGLVHTAMSAPTKMYASMPGQTPDQAACVICRALIGRPRWLGPWWLTPLHWLSPPAQRVFEWLQYRFQPVDPGFRDVRGR